MTLRALALRNLANRFSAEQLRRLKPEAANKLLDLIIARAREVENQNAALRQELNAIFGGNVSGGEPIAITDENDLKRAAARLSELVSANDRAVRSAFAFSSGAASADAVRAQQFRRSLGAVESLANKIQSAAARLKNGQNDSNR